MFLIVCRTNWLRKKFKKDQIGKPKFIKKP